MAGGRWFVLFFFHPQGVAIGLIIYCPFRAKRAFVAKGLRLWALFPGLSLG